MFLQSKNKARLTVCFPVGPPFIFSAPSLHMGLCILKYTCFHRKTKENRPCVFFLVGPLAGPLNPLFSASAYWPVDSKIQEILMKNRGKPVMRVLLAGSLMGPLSFLRTASAYGFVDSRIQELPMANQLRKTGHLGFSCGPSYRPSSFSVHRLWIWVCGL